MRMIVKMAAIAAAATTMATGAFAQTRVNIGYATATDFLPAFMAKENGCFDKNKIDATLTRMPIVGNIPAALISGSLQIGMSTPTVLLQAREGGLDIVAIAGATRMTKENPMISLTVRKGLEIKTAADVKGKKIGVPGINSVIDVMFKKWLKNNGVKLDDVTFIETPFPQMPDLLKAGTIDGAVAVEPIRSRIVSSDIGYRLPQEFYAEVNPDSISAFWAAPESWVKANPETLKAFRTCLVEGLADARKNPDQAKEVEKKYLGFNTPVLPTIVTEIKPADFTFFADLTREMGLTRKPVNVEALVAP